MENAMTPAGIEPATFQFVAQHLNHYATADTVPYIVILQGTIDTGSFFQKLWHNFFQKTYFRVYHLHLILPNGLFHLGFPTKILLAFLFSYIHIYIHIHGCTYTDK